MVPLDAAGSVAVAKFAGLRVVPASDGKLIELLIAAADGRTKFLGLVDGTTAITVGSVIFLGGTEWSFTPADVLSGARNVADRLLMLVLGGCRFFGSACVAVTMNISNSRIETSIIVSRTRQFPRTAKWHRRCVASAINSRDGNRVRSTVRRKRDWPDKCVVNAIVKM